MTTYIVTYIGKQAMLYFSVLYTYMYTLIRMKLV